MIRFRRRALRSMTSTNSCCSSLRSPNSPVQQHLGVAADRRQRGAQLVRDRAHQLVLHAVQLAQLRVLLREAVRGRLLGGQQAVPLQRQGQAARDGDERVPGPLLGGQPLVGDHGGDHLAVDHDPRREQAALVDRRPTRPRPPARSRRGRGRRPPAGPWRRAPRARRGTAGRSRSGTEGGLPLGGAQGPPDQVDEAGDDQRRDRDQREERDPDVAHVPRQRLDGEDHDREQADQVQRDDPAHAVARQRSPRWSRRSAPSSTGAGRRAPG